MSMGVTEVCQYRGCNNKRSDGRRLFSFPTEKDERSEIWIINSGRESQLRKFTLSSLRRGGFCSDHFSPKSFWDKDRKKLKPRQNPLPYKNAEEEVQKAEKLDKDIDIKVVEDKRKPEGEKDTQNIIEEVEEETQNIAEDVEEETQIVIEEIEEETQVGEVNEEIVFDIIYEVESATETLIETRQNEFDKIQVKEAEVLKSSPLNVNRINSTSIDYDSEWTGSEASLPNTNSEIQEKSSASLETKRQSNVERMTEEYVKLRQEYEEMKQEVENLRQTMKAKDLEFKNKMASLKRKKIGVDQFSEIHKKVPFTKDEKNLEKKINYYSPSTFRQIRKSGLKLPARRSSIQNWINQYDIKPGFSDVIYNKLAAKMNQLPPDQRICGLKWDEFNCTKYEEYSKNCDGIENLVDLGPLGKRDVPATNILVFSLNCLNAKNSWSQLISYFLTDKNVTVANVAELVKRCLLKLVECRVDVRLLTCDQKQHCIWKEFAATKKRPYFEYVGRTYFCSYDIPYLIKGLLRELQTHQYLYNTDGKIIANYQDYVKTWLCDQKSCVHLIGYITELHLTPTNWEDMNIKRTLDFFTRRFAASIRLAGHDPKSGIVEKGVLHTWERTAAFTDEMNRVIDSFRVLKNPNIVGTLKNFVKWSSTWTTNPESKTKAPCLKGLPFTVNAILLLYQSIQKTFPDFNLASGLWGVKVDYKPIF